MDVADHVLNDWDDGEFEHALNRARQGTIDAPNRRITKRQLKQLLAAAPPNPDDPAHPRLNSVQLRGAKFTGDADFRGATFAGDACFEGAIFTERADFIGATFVGDANFFVVTFTGDADFRGATFTGDAKFEGASFTELADFIEATFAGEANFFVATFAGDAYFERATFTGDAKFEGATFTELADFIKATFAGDAWLRASFSFADFLWATFTENAYFERASFTDFADFAEANFTRDARFDDATFTGHAAFAGANFTRDARFDDATFTGGADFDRATFTGDAYFGRATFDAGGLLGPLLVYERLTLDRAVFSQRIRIVVSARRVSLTGTEFQRGADVRLRWAHVWLEDTDFAEKSLLTSFPALRTLLGEDEPFLGLEALRDDGAWYCPVSREPPTNAEPLVLTLGGSEVARLTLSGVDLQQCRFATAHGLNELGFERVRLPESPKGWRWTHRQTIAEEHHWRARGTKAAGWNPAPLVPFVEDERWLAEQAAGLPAEEIASLYRQLRKAREDSGDKPGANDFYYGEMEMRRHSTTTSRAEGFILWAYWLVAGYGLRASRALLALAATVLVGAVALALWGFHPTRSYGRSLLFALESSISLLRATTAPAHETVGGQVVEIILRLAGPLFFGLALFALRGRVKR